MPMHPDPVSAEVAGSWGGHRPRNHEPRWPAPRAPWLQSAAFDARRQQWRCQVGLGVAELGVGLENRGTHDAR